MGAVVKRLRDFLVGQELERCKRTLPEEVEPLKHSADDASKVARNVFAFHFSLHAYAFVAVAGLGGADFLRPVTILPLPMIDVSLPIVGFFVVMPLLSIGATIYLQLHLDHIAMLRRRVSFALKAERKSYLDDPWGHTVANPRSPSGAIARGLLAFLTWGASPMFIFFCMWTVAPTDKVPGHEIAVLGGEDMGSFALSTALEIAGLLIGVVSILWSMARSATEVAVAGVVAETAVRRWRPQIWARMFLFVPLIGMSQYRVPGAMDLRDSDLNKAELKGADLRRVNFRGAMLTGARMMNADLQRANFISATLDDASLVEARMQGAQLQRASLTGAVLRSADLPNARLFRAKLNGAFMQRANLDGARLRQADLSGADLRGASLRGAELDDASLKGAILEGADLSGAILSGTDLRGVDLRQVKLDEATELSGALYSAGCLPDGLDPGSNRMRLVEDTRDEGILGCQTDPVVVGLRPDPSKPRPEGLPAAGPRPHVGPLVTDLSSEMHRSDSISDPIRD